MKRILWTLGMPLIGLFLALKGQDVRVKVSEIAIGGIWGGVLGFSLGSIFARSRPGRMLIIYWGVALALLGLFFGALIPVASFVARQTLGGVIGTLVGTLLGTLHLKVMRRKMQTPDAGAAVG